MKLSLLITVCFAISDVTVFGGITWTYAPGDTTISCGDDESFFNTGQPLAATDCALGSAPLTFVDVKIQSGICVNDSVITRTWTATDPCGNTESYDQIITIVDTLAPNVFCPAELVLQSTDGIDEDILYYPPFATIFDACSDYSDLIIIQTPASGTNLPLGAHNIHLSVTDMCGYEASCDITLHIYDTSGLYMTGFPSDTLVDCEHSLSSALLGTGTAFSTCPVGTVTYSKTDLLVPGPCDGADTIVRSWTASDMCGNTENYTQVITTYDDEPPFILCMVSDTFCNSTNGINAFLGDYTSTTAEIDNCSPTVLITQKPIPGAVEPVGVKTVWLYATDDCGNIDSCSLSVVVGDTSGLAFPGYDQLTFNVYPNPAKDKVTITLPNVPGKLTIRISDFTGRRLVHLEGLKGNMSQEILLDQNAGLYLIEVFGSGYRQATKLILE